MLYPQQNRFRNTQNLSGIWSFQTDAAQLGEASGWPVNGLPDPRPIAVPASWNEQYDDLYHYFGLAWYVNSVYLPQAWRGERIFLRVGSANYFAKVYLNGVYVGQHEGGFLPFSVELTDLIRWDEKNRIAISVENELKPDRVPAGNMDTPLQSVSRFPKTTYDFFPYAGIHRPVVLFSLPQIYIEDVTVTTEVDGIDGHVNVRVRLNEPASVVGSISIYADNAWLSAELHFVNGAAEALLTLTQARLWSDREPYLYNLIMRIPNDEYELKIGIRTVEVNKGRILLNGKPVQLNGFGRHEDFYASGKGLNLPLLVKDYQLMRWLGANSYRTSHYPYSEEEMQLADQQGFLIINEIPAVSLLFDDEARVNNCLNLCLQQLDELIARDKNHPSVLIWSVANEPMLPKNLPEADEQAAEANGKKFLNRLIHHAHELDPTRLTTFAALHGSPASWLEHCDILCINRYWGWYVWAGELEPALSAFAEELDSLWQTWGKPIVVAEFGADALAGMHGHPSLMWTEEYQAEFIKGHLSVAAQKAYIAGMHVWNFADFAAVQSVMRVGGFNMKGVFTRSRTPKLAAHVLKDFWS